MPCSTQEETNYVHIKLASDFTQTIHEKKIHYIRKTQQLFSKDVFPSVLVHPSDYPCSILQALVLSHSLVIWVSFH